MNQKSAQFNFAWMFAIIAGGAILFLAIYGAVQTSDSQRELTDSKAAKSIAILTDPLQAGFSEGSIGKILFKEETRINNFCEEDGFGRNSISVSIKSDIGNEWNAPGKATKVENKYIFSDKQVQGKEFFVLSKPFNYPYKVADLIFLTSKDYCFFSPPSHVNSTITALNIQNIHIKDCPFDDAVRVCFGNAGNDCDIDVTDGSGYSKYEYGIVEKKGKVLIFSGDLIYAAIFSDPTIYECNVKRLLHRTGKIAENFAEKTVLMDARGCGSNLRFDLEVWATEMINASSRKLIEPPVIQELKDLDSKNSRELCGVWD